LLSSRPSPPGQGLGPLGHPAGLGEGPAQQHFDLGVQATELVAGPPHQRVVYGGVDAEQYLSAFAHV
jgi:hypothetical protein